MDLNKKIEELKLVPVVVLQDAKDAVPLAKALIAGGLPVAEVTFRTVAAADSIKAISEACPEMLVGERGRSKVHRYSWILQNSYRVRSREQYSGIPGRMHTY